MYGSIFSHPLHERRRIDPWMQKIQRAVQETETVNATNHALLRYVGGAMSIEMEIPKILWLKNNLPDGLFEKCKFYDLVDALTHFATGGETRSYCSAVCKQGFVPVGVDGSVKGWQNDFLTEVGLGVLAEEGFSRIGGVRRVVSFPSFSPLVVGLGS
jgi:ribulose kinase